MSDVSQPGKQHVSWLLPTRVTMAYLLIGVLLCVSHYTFSVLMRHYYVLPLGEILLLLLSAVFIYWLVLHLDAERQRAAATWELTRQQHHTILDATQDIFLMVDHDDCIVDCNAAASQHYQYTCNELMGMRYDDLLCQGNGHPTDETRSLSEAIHRRKDGTTFPVKISVRACTLEGQRGYVYVIQNTEKRQGFAEALAEERYQFDTLMDNIPDTIYFKDADGRFTRVNQAIVRYFGKIEAAELIGKTDFDFFTKPHAQQAANDEQRIIATGAPAIGVIEKETWSNREDRWVSTTKLPFRDRSGRIVGTCGISRDVTDLKRAEDELRQLTDSLSRSNTELQQFAYVASHDLQEPLRMVTSYVQLLARRYRGKLDADADEFIDYAVDGATRMKTLINDLLTYSRVGTNAKPFAPADGNALLQSALDNLHVAIDDAGAVITAEPLPVVMADTTQLPQVFQNLIGNAIKFHRAGEAPSVHISAHQEEGHWRIAIRDNGIGIDPQYAERIFVIFQRLHTREEYSGTGIGLSVCKKIVERHGGEIGFTSAPGQGTTFYFTLPMVGGNVDAPTRARQSC